MCNTEQDEAVVAQREDGVLVVQQASDAFIARDAERRELGPYAAWRKLSDRRT